MDFRELVQKRRSVRTFTDEPVTEEQLHAILRAALMSPTSKNQRSWQFVVIRDKATLEKLSEAKESGSQFLAGAKVGIAVLGNPSENDCWIEDCSIAAVSMQYQAEELGLGSCWVQLRGRSRSDGTPADAIVHSILDLEANVEALCILGIGHKGQERKLQDEDSLQLENVIRQTTRTNMTSGAIGTGAIGGYYGGRLAQAGHEVHFLLHRDYEHVKKNGLQINSCKGSFHLDKVNAYGNSSDMPACDVVIVALKTVNQSLLLNLLPPLLKPESLVLLIQNGIGVEAETARMFPDVRFAAGMAFICAAKNKPGTVDHYDFGSINIGPYNCGADAVSDVVQDFCGAGVEARMVGYLDGRWNKALWNMPFNGLSVLLNASTADLLGNPDSEALVKETMLEVVCAAQAIGCKTIAPESADRLIEMTRGMTPYSPSMKLDWEYGRPMEIEYIYTRAIAEALEAGVTMPRLQMLEQALRCMEKARKDRQAGQGITLF